MEIASSDAEVLHLEQLAVEVADLVEHWRAEIGEPDVRKIDRAKLWASLDRWGGAGLDTGLLAYVILGCEWLLRARLGTPHDIRRAQDQIEGALCNPLRSPLAADHAALLIDALRPSLEKQLRGQRFLVSLELWAVRGRFSKWQTWATAKQGTGIVRPVAQVRKKQGGRIPTLAPIVAGGVAEAIAREAGAEVAESLGLTVTEQLLRRAVPAGEYRRWGHNLDQVVEEEPGAASGASPPMTARQWLARHLEFGYRALCVRSREPVFLQECRQDPRKAFDLVANSEIVAILYGLSWATGRRDASGAVVS